MTHTKSRLFDKYELTTPDGDQLQYDIRAAIRQVAKKYADLGFSLVDIELLIIREATLEMASHRTALSLKMKQEDSIAYKDES